MTEADAIAVLRTAVQSGQPVEVSGGGTLLDRLPAPPVCQRISLAGHSGIVSWEPSDLVVTVRAGTRVDELNELLDGRGQECPIDGPGSTVGGRIASGLSGLRRLGVGAVREWLLGVRMITAAGQAVQLGGRTVKDVTGYDLPRLLCGSWGTLGVLTELTLRVRPRPLHREWYTTDSPGEAVLRALYRPAAVLRTRELTHVLLEGHPDDCRAQAARARLDPGAPPRVPTGVRIAVPPANVAEVSALLSGEYAAEVGVGVIHADPPAQALAGLRKASVASGGRMLVFGRNDTPVFGGGPTAFDARVRQAFDPAGIFAPWRFAA